MPLATGVDLLGAAIDLALGDPPRLAASRRGAAAIQFLASPPGTVVEISGLDECRALQGVRDIALYVAAGDRVRPLVDNSCRIGHVVCEGPTPYDASRLVQQAASLIHVKTAADAMSSAARPPHVHV